MSVDPEHMAEDRQTVMLRELAGLSLMLARDLQVRALEAESVEDATRLAAAFHQVSRGLRQTLALELKLVRYKDDLLFKQKAEADLAETKARAEAEAHGLAVDQVRDGVWTRVGDAFWSEHEDPDWNTTEDGRELPPRPPASDPMWEKLDAFLDEAEQQDDFLTRDFDILVIEAMDAIGADPTLLYDIRGREPAEAEPALADSS